MPEDKSGRPLPLSDNPVVRTHPPIAPVGTGFTQTALSGSLGSLSDNARPQYKNVRLVEPHRKETCYRSQRDRGTMLEP